MTEWDSPRGALALFLHALAVGAVVLGALGGALALAGGTVLHLLIACVVAATLALFGIVFELAARRAEPSEDDDG